MKIHVTRQATPDEADAILEARELRAIAGEAVRAELERHLSADKLAAVIATLPPDAQIRINRLRDNPPVRRTVRLIIRKPRSKP